MTIGSTRSCVSHPTLWARSISPNWLPRFCLTSSPIHFSVWFRFSDGFSGIPLKTRLFLRILLFKSSTSRSACSILPQGFSTGCVIPVGLRSCSWCPYARCLQHQAVLLFSTLAVLCLCQSSEGLSTCLTFLSKICHGTALYISLKPVLGPLCLGLDLFPHHQRK